MITKTTMRKIPALKVAPKPKREGRPQSQKARASSSLNWLHRTLAGISTSHAMYQVAKEHRLLQVQDPLALTPEQERYLAYLHGIIDQIEELRKKAIGNIKHFNSLKK